MIFSDYMAQQFFLAYRQLFNEASIFKIVAIVVIWLFTEIEIFFQY